MGVDGFGAGFRFGSDGADAGVGLGVDGLGLAGAGGLLDLHLGSELGDGDRAFGIDDASLRVGHGACLLQVLACLFGQLLRLVSHLLLLGNFAVGQRLHQRFRRRDVADQRVNGVHVVLAKRRSDGHLSFRLPLAALLQKLNYVRGLCGVAKVIADGWLQHLRY